MSKHIIMDEDLHRINLGDGDWIDILEMVPNSVRRDSQTAAMNIKSSYSTSKKGADSPVDVDFNVAKFNQVLLYGMIKAWSFKDKEGKPIPVEPAYIDRLDEQTADLVLTNIDKLNPSRSEVSKKA